MLSSEMLKVTKGLQSTTTIDLTTNLVAHYLLNNNSDDSHGTYDGTPSGGVDFLGDSAEFDGVDSIVQTTFPYLSNNSSYTFSFWINPKTAQSGVYKQPFSFYNLSFSYDHVNPDVSGDIGLRDSSGTWLNGNNNNAIQHDIWTHVILEGNNTTLTLYLDNISSSTLTWDGTFYELEGTPLNIGATYAGVPINMFDGQISNTRI